MQLELAQAAQSANDTATVIAAYEAFLRLAPDDPTARKSAGSSSSTSSSARVAAEIAYATSPVARRP